MRNPKTILLSLAIILFVSMSFKCGGSGAGTDDPFRPAARALDDIAIAINSMIKVKRLLAQRGEITPNEELVLTYALISLNNSDKAAHATLKSVTTGDTATRAVLLARRSDLASSIDALSASIHSIKNLNARSTLQRSLEYFQAPLTILMALTPTPTPMPCENLGGGCFRCPPNPCKYCPGASPSCP